MKEAGIEDAYDVDRIRKLGVIDLPTIQKKANLHYSLSLDLFGSEISTNAANAFNTSVKGRYREGKIDDDHRLTDATYPVSKLIDGTCKIVEEPALTALNMRLRDDYVRDCTRGVARWNKIIEKSGVEFRLDLPHLAFHRSIGEFASIEAMPSGQIVSESAWQDCRDNHLPTSDDADFVSSLMQQNSEPGTYASWIAPPSQGIDNQPGDFEYVRIAE